MQDKTNTRVKTEPNVSMQPRVWAASQPTCEQSTLLEKVKLDTMKLGGQSSVEMEAS